MKISSSKVLLSSFLPYVLTGGIISIVLKNLNIEYISEWPILIIKGFLFCLSFVVLTYLLLNDDDKQFVRKLVKK